MDSSDFLRQILFQPYLVKKTPYVRRTSPGTRMFLLTIYLPWLLNMLPYSYWALTCRAALPTYSAFMISVRQASDLPPASFRFPVTQDTLALGYILPAVGRIRDFHPLKHAPAGRTRKTGGTHKWSTACCNFVVLAAPHPSRLGRGAFPGGEGFGWQRFIRGYAAARGPCP